MNNIKYLLLRFCILLIYALLMTATIGVAFGTFLFVDYYAQFVNEILRRNIGWISGLFLSGLLIMGIRRLIPYINMLEDFAQKIKAEQ